MNVKWEILVNESVFYVEEVFLAKQKLIRRPVNYNVKVNYLTGCLEFLNFEDIIIFTVDLIDIKQIRNSQKCKESMTYLKYSFENGQFAILYGGTFLLKCLLLKALNRVIYDEWIVELPKAVEFYKNCSYQLHLTRFLTKQYCLIHKTLENRNLRATFEKLKLWYERNNYKIQPNNEFNQIFDTHQHLQSLPLTVEKFIELYDYIVLTPLASLTYKMFRNYFPQQYTVINQSKLDAVLDEDSLRKWFLDNQLDNPSVDELAENVHLILSKYSDGKPSITNKNFLLYLISKENSIFDVKKSESVYQDMNQPMSHYWISCSHNTYLSGNQFTSDSSVECYIRALQLGCRSVEIDAWNGNDNSIVVTHGRTRCGQIDFKDVINGINAYAFEYSNYPLIISIENHCSIENQRKMAMEFKSVFGNKLVTDFLNPNEKVFPSPNELAGRVILKNAKNPSSAAGNYESRKDLFRETIESEEENVQEIEIFNEQEKKYEKYVIKIENMQIYYWKLPFEKDCQENEEPLYKNLSDVIEAQYVNMFENEDEPWLIDNLTRKESEFILTYYKECFQSGTFLIRNSETNSSDYTLCVLFVESIEANSQIFFLKIRSFMKNNELMYTIDQNFEFSNLIELVAFYRSNPVIAMSENRLVYLGVGVHKRTIMLKEDWYMPEQTRVSSYELLMRYKNNGSFLIRASESSNAPNEDGQYHAYTLSFFVQNQTYYAKIFAQVTNEFEINYIINNKEFFSLKDLVGYYRETPVYGNQTLTRGMKSIELLIDSKTAPASLEPRMNSDNYNLSDIDQNYLDIATLTLNCNYNEEIKEFDFLIIGRDSKKEKIKLIGKASLDAYNNVFSRVEALKLVSAANNLPSPNPVVPRPERLHQEFSDLIFYCQSVKFKIETPIGKYYEICSFAEPKIPAQHIKIFNKRHLTQLSRVYPQALRINSSNFDPVSLWAHSFQLLALNYQTPDKPMQINQAKFVDNGRCGYILRPSYMLDENYAPSRPIKESIYKILVKPIFAHFLPKLNDDGKSTSPFVEIEVITHEADALNRSFKKYRTNQSKANGLFPIWFEKNPVHARFDVINLESSFLRFSVYESDVIGSDVLLAQATYTLACTRKGYRSVILKNVFNEDIVLSSLLVEVSIEKIRI